MDFLTSKVTTILIIINVGIFLLETKDGGKRSISRLSDRDSITGSLRRCSCTSEFIICCSICTRSLRSDLQWIMYVDR